jgi:hypothetical protein
MNSRKIVCGGGLMVGLGCVLVGLALFTRKAAQSTASGPAPAVDAARGGEGQAKAPVMTWAGPRPGGPVPGPSAATSQAQELKTDPPPVPTNRPAPVQELIRDPLARIALSFVGADAQAELYWVEAINDPGLSGHERQDLIEDLNEDGISDPEHPRAEDLPLILSRLLLIEELAPWAMDEVNADAFQEAKKDLANMAESLLLNARPSR